MPTRFLWARSPNDDCCRVGATFYPGTTWLRIGRPTEGVAELAIRCRGATIPQGANVTTAVMRFVPKRDTYIHPVLTRIRAENTADPQPITSYADFMARTLTTQYKQFNDKLRRYEEYHWWTPDLTDVIKPLVDAYGIGENGVHIFLKDDGSPLGRYRDFYSYESGSEAIPHIEITYIEPPAPPPMPLWTLIDHYAWWDGATLWILAVTDRPCNLTMRYQQAGIVVHERITIRRGVEDDRDPHLAFDNYMSQNQAETGDTLRHTFGIDGFYPCKSYFWMFVGTVAGQPSPSKSPVFTYHLAPGPWSEIRRPAFPGDLTEFPSVMPLGVAHWSTICELVRNPDTWCGKAYGIYIKEPKTDLFRSKPLKTPLTPIESITLRAWWYGSGAGVYHHNRHVLKTYDTIYRSPDQVWVGPGHYWNSWTWETNPYTGLPWTFAEVNDLQFGEYIWIADGGGAMQLEQLYQETTFVPIYQAL